MHKLFGKLALILSLPLLWGCVGGVALPPQATPPSRPNIILITAEDLSPRLGSYGDAVAVTPNIDALASQGVRFERAFTTAGVCAPSRSALITGVQQQTLGTMHMRTSSYGKDMAEGAPYEAVPPADVKAFPELLRAAGYHTINRQKTDYQFGEPFTIWDDNAHSGSIPANIPQRPFFAMINFPETHEGRTWPPDTDPALNPNVAGAVKRSAQLDAAKTFPPTDPARVRVPAYYPDTPEVRANLARHYDNIRVMDQRVGQLLDRLRAEGRFDDSIIIFTTDHGDGLPRAKRTIFDSGTRVPLIIRFPDGRGAGSVRRDLASFVDLAPTILAFAGVEAPVWIQGRDLFSDPVPEAIFMGGDRFDEVTQRFRGVREERYLYIRYFGDTAIVPQLGYQDVNPIMREWRRLHAAGRLTTLQASLLEAPAPREMLFDTWLDPDNVINLATDPAYAGVRERLTARLDQWIERSKDLGRLEERDMVAAMWPDGVQPQTAAVSACRDAAKRIVLVSSTPGASIGYGGPSGEKLLYVTPLEESESFAARAIRYGYSPSDPTVIDPLSLTDCR